MLQPLGSDPGENHIGISEETTSISHIMYMTMATLFNQIMKQISRKKSSQFIKNRNEHLPVVYTADDQLEIEV
jgi:hypothetical protein